MAVVAGWPAPGFTQRRRRAAEQGLVTDQESEGEAVNMRAQIFGCPIDILTMRETIDLARSAMAQQKTMVHVALNVAKLVNMRTDPILAEDVKKSDLIGIDGMGIL